VEELVLSRARAVPEAEEAARKWVPSCSLEPLSTTFEVCVLIATERITCCCRTLLSVADFWIIVKILPGQCRW
jgi:hypothetical protein